MSTAQPGNLTEWNSFGVGWADLARVLGQPAPYWPYMLRVPMLIAAWKPGAPAVTYPTIPEVDTTPLLRLAAILPQDSPTHEVLLHLARVTQHRSTSSTLGELEILAQCEQRRRGGWLEILARTDRLAAECVRIATMWDGGRDFPFSNPEQIDPNTEYGAEWAARLKPIGGNAAFAIIDSEECRETLTDPETGALVVRKPDGLLLATIPQQLPTFGPLAEVIFDRPIWVRTEDGRLYPAPKDSHFGLNWSYPGSGPGSLALLISRLLDDINARGADSTGGEE